MQVKRAYSLQSQRFWGVLIPCRLTTTAQLQPATRLGFEAGQIIQEYYFDDDADMALRAQLEEALGSQLVDEDYADVVDGAIAWWREEDGGRR